VSATKTLPWLTEYLDGVNSELAELYPAHSPSLLEDAVADSLSGGGKRVRAILALLWCETFSGDYRRAIPLAAAYELAHASALVQDDIIDNSSMRRGRKSIVAKYGVSNAILASNLLLFYVPKMVAKYADLESSRLARLFDLVGESCRATTWGEFLDLEMTRKEEVSESEYEEMIRLKTSTLLSAPSASGAILGGASDEQISLASRFGELLGMAYQVQDDTLDLVGDERILGKPVFTDLRGGKKSFILIHCMRRCSAEERSFIRGLVNRAGPYTDGEISEVRRLLEENGSIDYAHGRTSHYVGQAKDVLSSFPESRATTMLHELADYLAERYS
jgi:geranylgeranyl pyrophosphate synthase